MKSHAIVAESFPKAAAANSMSKTKIAFCAPVIPKDLRHRHGKSGALAVVAMA